MSTGWSGALMSGNPIIDFQHRMALEMFKKLMVDFQSGGNKFTLEEAITFFDCYSIEHFGDEEDIISRHKLPDIDKHAEEHRRTRKNVITFKETVASKGYSRSLTAELLALISGYLSEHFQKSDKSIIINLKKIYTPYKQTSKIQTVSVIKT